MEISYEESSEGANDRNLLCGSLVGKMAEHGERNTEEYVRYKEIEDHLNKLSTKYHEKSMKELNKRVEESKARVEKARERRKRLVREGILKQ